MILSDLSRLIGVATNIVAVHSALVAELQMALDHRVIELEVVVDSPVVTGPVVEERRSWRTTYVDRAGTGVCRLFSTVSVIRVPQGMDEDTRATLGEVG